jgi:hypothetical protein
VCGGAIATHESVAESRWAHGIWKLASRALSVVDVFAHLLESSVLFKRLRADYARKVPFTDDRLAAWLFCWRCILRCFANFAANGCPRDRCWGVEKRASLARPSVFGPHDLVIDEWTHKIGYLCIVDLNG